MKKEKLIINGNAFYEIDLDCMEKKKSTEKHPGSKAVNRQIPSHPEKRQRK